MRVSPLLSCCLSVSLVVCALLCGRAAALTTSSPKSECLSVLPPGAWEGREGREGRERGKREGRERGKRERERTKGSKVGHMALLCTFEFHTHTHTHIHTHCVSFALVYISTLIHY